jgi:acetyltransferase
MLSGDEPLDYRSEIVSEGFSHSTIRPYPLKYVCGWKSKQGEEILLRPIRPEDEPMMVRFHGTLSDQTVYLR